jgi:hypothetical protein
LAGIAAAIPATPSVASIQPHADAELLRLSEQLKAAWAVEEACVVASDFDVAAEKSRQIVEQIERCTATTLGGFRVKALAVQWCWQGEPDIQFGEDQTTDVRLAQSILRDLVAGVG